MPRKCEWLQRLPDALAALERYPAPVIDRAALESLLGLGRREAIRLMHRFGGYQAGRTFLLDRALLERRLRDLAATGEVQYEQRRRSRLAEHLETARRDVAARQVVIRPPASPGGDLPAGVRFRKGTLEIDFGSAEQLLENLLALAQYIGRDFERFRTQVGG